MALNNLGLGFLFSAQDLASGVMGRVRNNFIKTEGVTSQSAQAIGKSFAQFGSGMAVFGAGVAGLALLGSSVQEANEFGKAIALVATEADLAVFPQEQMHDIALKLAGQFGKMPKDEAEAMYKAVALGANDAAKANFMLTASNQLAVAGNADLKEVMDALGGTLNSYHMDMSKASEVSDAIFTAMKGGNTTVQDLASSIGRVNAGASAMGISVQETLGAISVMTNKGVKASEAVSGLHGALANITHPSKEAQAEASRLGIKFSAAAVRAQGFQGFLHSITDSAKFNKDSLSKLFMSVEGSNAMAMLAGDMGSVDAIMKEMNGSQGATARGFEIMAATASFQEARFASLTSAVKILIGEAIEPLEVGILKVANTILEGFQSIPKPFRDIGVRVFAVVSAVTALLGSVLAAKAAMAMFMFGMSAAGISVGGLLLSLLPVIAAIGVVTLAVAAFRTAVAENVGGIGTFFKDAYQKASLAMRALGQLFSDGAFSGDVLEELEKGNSAVEEFAVNIFLWAHRIKNYFVGITEGFKEGINNSKGAFEEFQTALSKLAEQFGFVSDAVDPLVNQGKFDQAGASGKRMGVKLAELATILVKGITAFINFVTAVSQTIDKLGNLDTIIEAVKLGATAMASYLIADAVVSMATMGSSAVSAAISIGKLVLAMDVAAVASTFKAAMSGALASTAAALGPTLALAAAIMAVYLAYKQFQALSKQWDENSSGQIWTKLKHDVGITSDAEFDAAQQKRMGLVEHDDYDRMSSNREMDDHLDMLAARKTAEAKAIDDARGMYAPVAMSAAPAPLNYTPAPNQSQSDSSESSQALADAAAALQSTSQQPIVVSSTLMLNDEVLATGIANGNRSMAGRSFSGPISSQ